MAVGDDMNGNKELYTVNDVAEMIDVHPRTVRRYLRDGVLTGKKIGGQWRFTIDDIKGIHMGDFSAKAYFSKENHENSALYKDDGQSLQVSSIVNYGLDDIDKAKETADILFESVNESRFSGKLSFKFEFLHNEGKVRYTLWGAPSSIAEVLLKIR